MKCFAPRQVGETTVFGQEVFDTVGRLLAGFNSPIGLPGAYGVDAALKAVALNAGACVS
jgi:hypothetical protein